MTKFIWLVVGPPLKNMKVNWDDNMMIIETQYSWENKIDGNQTTNQLWILHDWDDAKFEAPKNA